MHDLRVVEQVVDKDHAITPTPDLGTCEHIVVNEDGTMIDLKFQRVAIAVMDKVAGHPRVLGAPVEPDASGPALFRADPADVIVSDNIFQYNSVS